MFRRRQRGMNGRFVADAFRFENGCARKRCCYGLPALRYFLQSVALSLGLSACAVGSAAIDGLVPDTSGGDGVDAAPPVTDNSTPPPLDAGPTTDSSQPPDGNAPSVDASTPKDSATPDAVSACPAAGFSGAIAVFDLASEPGDETSASATSSAKSVKVGALSRGGALTPMSGSASINSSNWPSSADPTRFYTFTITPAAGCAVSLTSLALDVHASSSGPSTGDVATSIDNFAAHHGALSGTGTTSVSLAGASGSGAIEVRVYAHGASSSGGTFRLQNTLTLSGSIN